MAKQPLPMRINCIDPIRFCLAYSDIRFGLQDKSVKLAPGMELTPDLISFDFSLSVELESGGAPNFTGPYAHGSRARRFVYLTYLGLQDEDWEIYRRIKVPLHEITREQVEGALASESVLQARVSGLRSGTVPLLGGGWQLVK